jgi:hypothetical protein
MFIVEVVKNLLSVDDVGWVGTRYSQLYTVSPCSSGGKECKICPTVLGETADRVGSIDDAVFPLISVEGETTFAKQLIIMDIISFVFTSYL